MIKYAVIEFFRRQDHEMKLDAVVMEEGFEAMYDALAYKHQLIVDGRHTHEDNFIIVPYNEDTV